MQTVGRPRNARAFLAAVLVACASLLTYLPLLAESHHESTSSRAAREDAIRSIPFNEITHPMRSQLYQIVSKPTIYRRLPVEVMHCDPDMYRFLVRHPEVIVNTWQLMGITKCSTRRTGPYSLFASDGVGTQTDIQLVYGTNDSHVIYAEGVYEGPVLKRPIKGRCVLLLRSGYARAADGRVLVTSQLDVFLQLDNVGADLIAKTLHPLVGRSADYNFIQSVQFVGRVCDAAESNGPGLQRLALNLTDLEPNVRDQFIELTAIVHHRAALRESVSMKSPRTDIVQRSLLEGVGDPLE